jgi:hypothetical protein
MRSYVKITGMCKKNYYVVLGPSEDQEVPIVWRISTFVTAGNPRSVGPLIKYPSPLLIQYSYRNSLLMMW